MKNIGKVIFKQYTFRLIASSFADLVFHFNNFSLFKNKRGIISFKKKFLHNLRQNEASTSGGRLFDNAKDKRHLSLSNFQWMDSIEVGDYCVQFFTSKNFPSFRLIQAIFWLPGYLQKNQGRLYEHLEPSKSASSSDDETQDKNLEAFEKIEEEESDKSDEDNKKDK